MAENKKRCPKITKIQKNILVDFMEANKPFARGQFSQTNLSKQELSDQWQLLSSKLNSQGPIIKTVEQWKKCWIDIKSAVKKQISDQRKFINKTGGGSITEGPRQLSEFEEKVLSVITMDAVDGDTCTPELGSAVVNSLCLKTAKEYKKEDEEPNPSKKRRTDTSVGYEDSLNEARKMHQTLESKLNKIYEQNEVIISQNKTILQKFLELTDEL